MKSDAGISASSRTPKYSSTLGKSMPTWAANRRVLVVNVQASTSGGTAERAVAAQMLATLIDVG